MRDTLGPQKARPRKSCPCASRPSSFNKPTPWCTSGSCSRRHNCPPRQVGSLALRDHAEQILEAIAKDIETVQSRESQTTKSLGRRPLILGAPETAAQTHAILRARSGFDINQLAAEYRALRASVLRLWTDAYPPTNAVSYEQLMRFNEAIDEALAESINYFNRQIEQARNLLLGMLGHDLRSPLQSIEMTALYLAELNAGAEVSSAAGR